MAPFLTRRLQEAVSKSLKHPEKRSHKSPGVEWKGKGKSPQRLVNKENLHLDMGPAEAPNLPLYPPSTKIHIMFKRLGASYSKKPHSALVLVPSSRSFRQKNSSKKSALALAPLVPAPPAGQEHKTCVDCPDILSLVPLATSQAFSLVLSRSQLSRDLLVIEESDYPFLVP